MARTESRTSESLWVWLDDPAFGPLRHIGTLSRGDKGAVRFSYRAEWLKSGTAFDIDPQLSLHHGEFFPTGLNFGIFMDSCPDRWGQILMKRREEAEADEQERKVRRLGPWDFLKGVQDITRMGALRFTEPDSELFIAAEALSAPPLTSLAELQAMALELSKGDPRDLDQVRQWLKVLVAPGSSLGGARPKANVTGKDGELWIAKFPAAGDERDSALWEKLVHDLAREAGVDVPESLLWKPPRGNHSFLVRRFDREKGKRRFFTSAMTLLGRQDGEEASYLELAEFISTSGAPGRLKQDLEQLFRRVLFNLAVANRDDHLRNHGFFRTPEGWALAPAFDMNSAFDKAEHSLAFDLDQHLPKKDLVISTAEYYRLGQNRALEISKEVESVFERWIEHARSLGIPREEIEAETGRFGKL